MISWLYLLWIIPMCIGAGFIIGFRYCMGVAELSKEEAIREALSEDGGW